MLDGSVLFRQKLRRGITLLKTVMGQNENSETEKCEAISPETAEGANTCRDHEERTIPPPQGISTLVDVNSKPEQLSMKVKANNFVPSGACGLATVLNRVSPCPLRE